MTGRVAGRTVVKAQNTMAASGKTLGQGTDRAMRTDEFETNGTADYDRGQVLWGCRCMQPAEKVIAASERYRPGILKLLIQYVNPYVETRKLPVYFADAIMVSSSSASVGASVTPGDPKQQVTGLNSNGEIEHSGNGISIIGRIPVGFGQ